MITRGSRSLRQMKWKVSLFGPFRLTTPDSRPFKTKSYRLKVLLAYLAAQPSLGACRSSLAGALVDPEELECAPNFALLLTRTRSALAEQSKLPLLATSSDHVSLIEESFESDWAAFERLVERARSTDDLVGAGLLWREALQIANQSPLLDIDHPLFVPVRQRMTGTVLEALVALASGPIGKQHATLILERLNSFQLERATDSTAVERLMRLYAALGMKDELVRTFSEFETYLDDEHGEGAPRVLSALFDSLLSNLDKPQAICCGQAPVRPQTTIGRDECLDDLVLRLIGPTGPNLTTLTGQCGIGKSHVLRELFWRVNANVVVGHFDLETQPPELVRSMLKSQVCDVVMIDHVHEDHHAFVGNLIGSYVDARFICASNSRLRLVEESIVTLSPLGPGDLDRPGPAIELLSRNIDLVRSVDAGHPNHAEAALLFEVADQCDGIPLALEIAGRLCGTTGVRATLGSLRRSIDGLTDDRRDHRRKSSLRKAIESSFLNLGVGTQRLVALLASLSAKCHVDQLLACTGSLPCDLEEAILSGLVSRDPGTSYVRVLRSTAAAVSAVAEPDPQDLAQYGVRAIDWFESRSAELPLDLDLAGCLPLALVMVGRLVEERSSIDAMRLLAAIRPWLGSWPLTASQLQQVDQLLMDPDVDRDSVWASAVLSLSAAYCHAGAFQRMSETTAAALESASSPNLSADIRCQMYMQFGIALRALDRFSDAIDAYQQAIQIADHSVSAWTVVKCYYNLGVLLETQERLAEALAAQEAAADHFSEATDPRVESLVCTCIGRLRYRLGHDLASAGLILEATLAHARDRQDKRSVGEILQNLGLICLERKHFAKAALVEAAGTSFLLKFGYTGEFRRLARSSFVTLCASLFELGQDELALATRTLIDRLGPADLYAPNKVLFEALAERTYAHPAGLKFALAAEPEVRSHLKRCLERLYEMGVSSPESLEILGLPHPPYRDSAVLESTVAAVTGS